MHQNRRATSQERSSQTWGEPFPTPAIPQHHYPQARAARQEQLAHPTESHGGYENRGVAQNSQNIRESRRERLGQSYEGEYTGQYAHDRYEDRAAGWTHTPGTATRTDAIPRTSQAPTYAAPQVPHARAQVKESRGQSLVTAMKGLRGAGEAIRGSVNQNLAKVDHNAAEVERQRVLKEQGVADWKASGLEKRLRRSREQDAGRSGVGGGHVGSGGIYGSEGPGGLDAVSERSVEYR